MSFVCFYTGQPVLPLRLPYGSFYDGFFFPVTTMLVCRNAFSIWLFISKHKNQLLKADNNCILIIHPSFSLSILSHLMIDVNVSFKIYHNGFKCKRQAKQILNTGFLFWIETEILLVWNWIALQHFLNSNIVIHQR